MGLSMSSGAAGALGFMAPEIFSRGWERGTGPPADVYACGVVTAFCAGVDIGLIHEQRVKQARGSLGYTRTTPAPPRTLRPKRQGHEWPGQRPRG
eukprot:gene10695-biopygen8056